MDKVLTKVQKWVPQPIKFGIVGAWGFVCLFGAFTFGAIAAGVAYVHSRVKNVEDAMERNERAPRFHRAF